MVKIGDTFVYEFITQYVTDHVKEIWIVTDIVSKHVVKVHIISTTKDNNGEYCLNLNKEIIQSTSCWYKLNL